MAAAVVELLFILFDQRRYCCRKTKIYTKLLENISASKSVCLSKFLLLSPSWHVFFLVILALPHLGSWFDCGPQSRIFEVLNERTTLFGICACVCVSQCSYSIHRAMLILENFKPMDERERNFNGTQNNTTSPVSFELCQRYNSHDQTMFTHRTLFPTPHFLYLFHAFLHKHTAIIPFLPNKKRSTLLK